MSAPRVWRCVENETCTVLVGAATEDGAVSILTLCIAAPALLAALKAMVEPFAMMTDDILREYPDTPQPRNILAARAAIAAAEGAST
jgi:hypothetical protein